VKALLLILMALEVFLTEASPAPTPQFQVSVDKGVITLRAASNGRVLGKTTFERLGVIAATRDALRHMALDVTAAVVAGNGSRKHTISPGTRVYSLAEKENAPYVTGTLEHGALFVLLSDTEANGRYEALIFVVKVRRKAQLKTPFKNCVAYKDRPCKIIVGLI
jgi:hypothetical protein